MENRVVFTDFSEVFEDEQPAKTIKKKQKRAKNSDKTKRKKDIILNLIICILVFIILGSGFYLVNYFLNEKRTMDETSEIQDIVKDNTKDINLNFGFSKEAFNALYQKNEDLVAYMQFDSGLLSLPVVQSPYGDNDYYLKKNFSKTYSELGIPFFDGQTKLEDQNLVIYGHNSAVNEHTMFSPLRVLRNSQQDYETNKRFKLFFEDEIRTYEIVYTFFYSVSNDSFFDYRTPNWANAQEFNEFLDIIAARSFNTYSKGVSYNDKFVTLQTCKSRDPDTRYVIFAKQVKVESYN